MAIELKKALVLSSVGASFNRGDFTNGNAFFWSSVDLSFYLKHFIELIDAAGKKATGYIGAVGAGETLGSELITGWTNGGYDTWASAGVDITSAIGLTDALRAGWQQYTSSSGWLVKLITTLAYTGNQPFFWILNHPEYTNRTEINDLVVGANTKYRTLLSAADDIAFITGAITNYSVISNSFKRVTDPPSTAVHIVSSLNGTTRNWASIESGFDPNNIASFKIYKYPNIKNKFSKFSLTKIYSLFDKYRNFQPTALWSARSLLINPSDLIWNYLIGWYWNSEGSGNIVYNMAPGNGLAGGGLLPNLNVINLGDYWSVSGYGYSPFDSNYAKAYSYCNFISRLISQNACLGMFINRKDIFTISHQCNVIELTKQNPTLATDYIKMQNLKNPTDYYFDMYWVTYASTTPFVPTINNWYFLFNDDTNIPKLAKPDGTLYTFDGAQIITPTDKPIEKLTLGAYWNGTSFLDGAGALLGDAFLFNNKRLTQAEWGVIYDLCASRYGMSARSW